MSIFDNFKNVNGTIVDTGWAKWLHTQVPDEPEDERNKIRKMLALLKHCLPCTALSGCYFAKHKFIICFCFFISYSYATFVPLLFLSFSLKF